MTAAIRAYRPSRGGVCRLVCGIGSASQILRIAILSFIILVSFIIIIITVSFITVAQRRNQQRIYSKTSPPGCFDRAAKFSTTAAIVAASPGVIWPPASAAVTACIADGAFAAWRQKSFDTEAHRRRVARKRKLDGFARQRLGLAREQCGGECCLVAGAGPAARRVARPALLEWAPAHRPRQFW
jgi:hypothetical protein